MDEDIYPNAITLDEAVALANPNTGDDESTNVEGEAEQENTEQGTPEVETEAEADVETSDEEEADDKPSLADLESEIEFAVNGETKRVKVKDLTRLAGQEAAITQKSQALAEQKRNVETHGLVAAKVIENQYKKATERLARYKDIDLNLAAREMSQEDYVVIRDAKKAAEDEVAFLENEAQHFLNEVRTSRQKVMADTARETIKAINDPTSQFYIPEWNDNYYSDLRTFAVKQGMDASAVNEVVDAGAIRILHLAYKGQQAEAKREAAKAKVKEATVKAPAKVVTKKAKTAPTEDSNIQALRTKFEKSRSLDDAIALRAAIQASKED